MQFFEVETAYHLFHKQYGYKDPRLFYKDVRKDYRDWQVDNKPPKFFFLNHINIRSLILEGCWYEENMPYYKVWPGVFDTFVKTRLDIKAELLKFPHRAFSIRLPETEEPLLSFDFKGYQSVINSIIMVGGWEDEEQGYVSIDLRVIYSSNHPDYPYPGHFHKIVKMPVDKTIEQGIGITDFVGENTDGSKYYIPTHIMDACVRLTVATMFLATGSHKVLEYDVLSKHLNAYREIREENAAKRKEYEDKAKSKGKFGWNIGSGRGDRSLKLPNGVSYEKACQDAGGREHLYQHVRGGHWHTVRYGEGRKDVKIVWFEETTVRKDLPPKPITA